MKSKYSRGGLEKTEMHMMKSYKNNEGVPPIIRMNNMKLIYEES